MTEDYKKKKKKSRDGFFTVGRVIALTVLSLLFIFLLMIYSFLNFYRPPQVSDGIIGGDPGSEWTWSPGENDNGEKAPHVPMGGDRLRDCYVFLLAGVDEGPGALTDTIMLALFNARENTLSVLNIPRDSFVRTPPYTGKINSGFAAGRNRSLNAGNSMAQAKEDGIDFLKNIIQFTFGVPVDRHILIDLEGFAVLVDEVDGVWFDVPLRMRYTDPVQDLVIDLQPGPQLLDGAKAEQLIRFRQPDQGFPSYSSVPGYPNDDFGRIRTQQAFLSALAKKLLDDFNLNTIRTLFDIGSRHMLTNMTTADVSWFAPRMTNVHFENVRFHTLPVTWVPSSGNSQIHRRESVELINRYYNPFRRDIPGSNFNICDRNMPEGTRPHGYNADGITMADFVG
jgi:LCP family protein required for cell wall assembly